MYLSLYCKSSKRLFKVCVREGVGYRTETAIFWPQLLWPSTLCLSHSPGLLNRRPRGPLCWEICYILSAIPLHPNSIGAPRPFDLVWLSLPHLVYNSVRSLTATVWPLPWLSYIIIQRPLSRLLDFWNRMLDHHQAERAVIQFTAHSLPVHQSMSVPWEFFYLVPFHFRPRDFLS